MFVNILYWGVVVMGGGCECDRLLSPYEPSDICHYTATYEDVVTDLVESYVSFLMVLIRLAGHWGQVSTCPPTLFGLTSKYKPSL